MNLAGLRNALGRRFRAQRMQLFGRMFQITPETRILDLGGKPGIWSLLPGPRPRLVILNVDLPERANDGGGVSWVLGDGRRLPFPDASFDIVFCNSVIEHVGPIEGQRLLAQEIRRVGRRYFVQTPNRRFFFEPHLLTPFIHWLPRKLMAKLLRYGTLWGLLRRPSEAERRGFMESVYLLDEQQMCRLFPDGRVWREPFVGMTKSIVVAMRGEPAGVAG